MKNTFIQTSLTSVYLCHPDYKGSCESCTFDSREVDLKTIYSCEWDPKYYYLTVYVQDLNNPDDDSLKVVNFQRPYTKKLEQFIKKYGGKNDTTSKVQ